MHQLTDLSQITCNDFFCKSCLQIITINSHCRLALGQDSQLMLTNLPRYILPFCFRNLNFNEHGASLNVMFPQFTLSYHFPRCFSMLLPVFFRILISVSPVSPQCLPCFLFYILQKENIWRMDCPKPKLIEVIKRMYSREGNFCFFQINEQG